MSSSMELGFIDKNLRKNRNLVYSSKWVYFDHDGGFWNG